MVHLSGHGYSAAVRPQVVPVLHGGKKAVHFGAAQIGSSHESSSSVLGSTQESTPKKKEEKKELPFPTEPNVFKRMANRVIQFFKDIFNAFGHLLSWRSAKDEARRSGEEFLGRPEIRSVVVWNFYEKPKFEHERDSDEAFKLDADEPHPRTSEARQKFAQEMVDRIANDYDAFLKEQEAAAKAKASGAAGNNSSFSSGRL